jgi:pimeloyl-ACP methyl ester carboxylesterase
VSGADRPGSSARPLLRSRSLHVDGLEFHHLEQGQGPPLLLLHGFPDHAAAWRPLLERLQGSSLRALAPDLRGYGATSAPTAVEDYRIERLVDDLVALLDAWGLPQAHVCGHDWGGVLAFELARRFPRRVASLVALNAPPPAVLQQMIWHHPGQRAASQYITLLRSPAADQLFHESAVDALIERFLGEPRRRGLLNDDDIAAYRDAWSRPGAWRSMLAWYRAARPRPRPQPRRHRRSMLPRQSPSTVRCFSSGASGMRCSCPRWQMPSQPPAATAGSCAWPMRDMCRIATNRTAAHR